mmetsp:Transcript_19378/g.43059  ORF Transcript_19378/g.43059 Transcript_19378/m.43059 type:complete len:90 (-) Transcript_19378:65-334(-)
MSPWEQSLGTPSALYGSRPPPVAAAALDDAPPRRRRDRTMKRSSNAGAENIVDAVQVMEPVESITERAQGRQLTYRYCSTPVTYRRQTD